MKMYHEISWGKQTTKTTPNSGRSWEGYEADLFSLNTLALKCLVMSKLLASDNVSVSLAQKGPPQTPHIPSYYSVTVSLLGHLHHRFS